MIRLPVFGHLGNGEPTVKPAYEKAGFLIIWAQGPMTIPSATLRVGA